MAESILGTFYTFAQDTGKYSEKVQSIMQEIRAVALSKGVLPEQFPSDLPFEEYPRVLSLIEGAGVSFGETTPSKYNGDPSYTRPLGFGYLDNQTPLSSPQNSGYFAMSQFTSSFN